MKKNKKKIIIIVVSVIVVLSLLIGYYILNRSDKNTTLTIIEKQWIETNKNKVVDFAILNNIPVLSNDGEGVVFDFFESLEETTNLSFNKRPSTSITDLKSEYSVREVREKAEKDLLIYKDHYVLVVKDEIKYHNQKDLKDLVIGVLEDDLSNVSKYLKDGDNLSYKSYSKKDELLASFETETTALAIPRLSYLELLMDNDSKYFIGYNIIEMDVNYVLTLGDNKTLNTIVKKYFSKWMNDNFDENFDKYFSNSYFEFNEIDNKEKVKFRSKRYEYGFLDNPPYDDYYSNSLNGINSNILSGFSKLADIEISYKKYNSISLLLKGFNSNNLDIIYAVNNNEKYKMDTVNTVAPFDNKNIIAVPLSSNFTINSLASLEKMEVLVVKDSKISSYLKTFDINVKEYNSLNELIKKANEESIIAINFNSYQYFIHNELKDYYIGHEFNINKNITFTLRQTKENEVFNSFFKFYTSYIDGNKVVNDSFNLLLIKDQKAKTYLAIFNIIGIVLFSVIALYEAYKYINKKSKKDPVLTKSDKLKYVDMLTSLKNRNYLNDSIEKWDASDIYPQSIVVVDLNNVAYINDNYGYQEGDKLITQASNILINTQVENSDIIRTSGNEFLVYLVGHDEKQTLAYMRRLKKEFRDLNHGFGAALGYSVISTGIKTIDDAINEAALDMRTNKENIEE